MPWPELGNRNVALGIRAHRAAIKTLSTHIERIEDTVTKALKPMPEYKKPAQRARHRSGDCLDHCAGNR